MGEDREEARRLMRSISNRSRRVAFGAVIGVGIGLLVDSVLLVPTSVYFLMAIWPVILPPVLGMGIGALLGWKGWMPCFSWPVSLLRGIALWVLCVWIPVKIRAWQFNSLAYREIPAYPGAKLIRSYIQPYMADGGSDVHLEFWLWSEHKRGSQVLSERVCTQGMDRVS